MVINPQAPPGGEGKKMQHDQTGEFDYGVEGGQSQNFGRDKTDGTSDPKQPAEPDAGPLSSANSADADPDTRHRSADQPVPQVTRPI